MNLDLDAIERVAQAATPGPWERGGGKGGGCELHVYGDEFAGAAICGMDKQLNFTSRERRIQNLDFIAAANPAVVLELVRRLRAAEENSIQNSAPTGEVELPPLPEPDATTDVNGKIAVRYFSDLKVVEYARAALRAYGQRPALKQEQIMKARMEGRMEALEIITAQDAESPFDDQVTCSANGDAGDYSTYWDKDALRELLHIDDTAYNAFDNAEEMYWDFRGHALELAWEAEQRRAPSQPQPQQEEVWAEPYFVGMLNAKYAIVGRTSDGRDVDLPVFGDGAKDGKTLLLVALPDATAEQRDDKKRIAELEGLLAEKVDLPPGDPVASVKILAGRLVSIAKLFGTVVTITQHPRQPFAMGNYETVVDVRPVRVMADPIVRGDLQSIRCHQNKLIAEAFSVPLASDSLPDSEGGHHD